jgi:hypothetical protein
LILDFFLLVFQGLEKIVMDGWFLDIGTIDLFDQSTSDTKVESISRLCNCSFALFYFYGIYARNGKEAKRHCREYEYAVGIFTMPFPCSYFMNDLNMSSKNSVVPAMGEAFRIVYEKLLPQKTYLKSTRTVSAKTGKKCSNDNSASGAL